ncbi:hypothetical protein A5N82_13385 [Christensenella minuta]|uniref:hypothetical protein n=1 Tax=Christensenella minuta TaxID=626937 RepID=UPI0007E1E0E8|nr:hypothetical protein [Christensenella minuta]AYH41605.1 hypothetical protein B1H56_14350 [Christensenella minuta]OAQ38688.1 hypothetical protein A5N82_13385 [Christensenella minuta]
MSKTCDRCGKELTDRDRTTICLECEVALAEEVIKNLEAENAALREKLAAAIEDIRRIAPCSLCKHNGKQPCENENEGHEKCFEWRGKHRTERER